MSLSKDNCWLPSTCSTASYYTSVAAGHGRCCQCPNIGPHLSHGSATPVLRWYSHHLRALLEESIEISATAVYKQCFPIPWAVLLHFACSAFVVNGRY